MNPDWVNFLAANAEHINKNSLQAEPWETQTLSEQLFPLTQLAVLSVSGQDAATFLQGQLTCNIDDLQSDKASLAAYCNAKGRAIANLIVIKDRTDYLLLLSADLLPIVLKKLRLYILRAEVMLTDRSDQLCLLGINTEKKTVPTLSLPDSLLAVSVQEDSYTVKVSDMPTRYIVVVKTQEAIRLWQQLTNEKVLAPAPLENWHYLDIVTNTPWVCLHTSEQFVPQMFSLDKMGGISFNKGCYTGQEIIARTHYLGKSKRFMIKAQCNLTEAPQANTIILNNDNSQTAGYVFQAQVCKDQCFLLVILHEAHKDSQNLVLDSPTQDRVSLLA